MIGPLPLARIAHMDLVENSGAEVVAVVVCHTDVSKGSSDQMASCLRYFSHGDQLEPAIGLCQCVIIDQSKPQQNSHSFSSSRHSSGLSLDI